jgi:hypothetical protein
MIPGQNPQKGFRIILLSADKRKNSSGTFDTHLRIRHNQKMPLFISTKQKKMMISLVAVVLVAIAVFVLWDKVKDAVLPLLN